MTLFGDIWFFLIAGVCTLPAIILGIMERPIKYYGFGVTVFFAAAASIENPWSLLWLAVYCILELILVKGYLCIYAASGRVRWHFWMFLILALAPLIAFKVAGVLGGNLFGFLGISYMTFKSVQVIIEIYDGLIKECDTFSFLYFLTFFPCLASGPIDRSRRFDRDLEEIPSRINYLENVGTGLFKICLGLVYKFALASGFYLLMTNFGLGKDLCSAWIYMYTYGFYLFFDFAGYSLMAVGFSYIFGIITPDNFNKPFLSTDIKEFWDRWHISLSHWFRDFIFSRFMMAAIRGKWFRTKLSGAAIGFIVNMTVMGIWHGLTWYYIAYGLYHGIILALTEVYQKKSGFYKKHKKEKWYRAVSWFITLQIVMFGFFIFSGRLFQLIGWA